MCRLGPLRVAVRPEKVSSVRTAHRTLTDRPREPPAGGERGPRVRRGSTPAHRGRYSIIQIAYLELAEPNIEAGGALCVERSATQVILLPYFLSPGKHVVEDLATARDRLSERFPHVHFALAEPLGRHPLLLEVLEERAGRSVASLGAHRVRVAFSTAPEGQWRETESGE